MKRKYMKYRPSLEMGRLEGMQTLDQALADLVRSGLSQKKKP